MKLALIGLGTVGSAMRVWLEKHTDHQLILHDPAKGHEATSFFGCDAAFIAIPVPTDRSRDIDIKALERVMERVDELTTPIFIRSTVLPGSFSWGEVIPMPEFLTARTAAEDFERLPLVVGSGGRPEIASLISRAFPGKAVFHVEPDAACLAKYAHNVFGAMKVNYFNIVAEAAKHLGVEYSEVIRAANVTGFLGQEHLAVPGPDGRYGYGGHCFSKDVAAFIGFLRDNAIRGADTIASCELDNALFRSEEAGSWIRKS